MPKELLSIVVPNARNTTSPTSHHHLCCIRPISWLPPPWPIHLSISVPVAQEGSTVAFVPRNMIPALMPNHRSVGLGHLVFRSTRTQRLSSAVNAPTLLYNGLIQQRVIGRMGRRLRPQGAKRITSCRDSRGLCITVVLYIFPPSSQSLCNLTLNPSMS